MDGRMVRSFNGPMHESYCRSGRRMTRRAVGEHAVLRARCGEEGRPCMAPRRLTRVSPKKQRFIFARPSKEKGKRDKSTSLGVPPIPMQP